MSSPIQVSPQIRITMADEDVTSHYVVDKGMNVELTTDFPTYAAFTTSSLTLHLDNSNLEFDPNNSSNFFTDNNYPQHGRRVPVLVELSITNNDFSVVFAGQIDQVKTTLEDTIAEILVVDLSIRFRNNEVRNYGEQVRSFNINSISGSNSEYAQFNPEFAFPSRKFPISKGSVSVETPEGVEIISTVRTEGFDLTYENAEVSLEDGKLKFEAEPPDEEEQDVTATWKYILRYKRPDTLAWMLLKNVDFYEELGYTNDTVARATIPRARLRHPDIEQFSSHGKIGFDENLGIVRWMKRTLLSNDNHINNQSPFWYFAADSSFIEYDEYQDSYKVLSNVAQGSDIEQIVTSGSYDYDQHSLDDPQNPSYIIFRFTGNVGDGSVHIIGERGTDGIRVSEEIEVNGAGDYVSNNIYEDEIFYTVNDVTGGSLGISAEPLSPWVIMQFDTVDFNNFYFLCTNSPIGDSSSSLTSVDVRIYKYVLTTDTWTLIAEKIDEQPQLAHVFDLEAGILEYADNRKTFRVIESGNQQYLYYIFGDSVGLGGVKRYSATNDTHTAVWDGNAAIASDPDLTYGVNFEIDITPHNTPSTPRLYVFVCYEVDQYRRNFEIYRTNLTGGTSTRIYHEQFMGNILPTSATDIILDDDNDRWYFVLSFSRSGSGLGLAELSRVNKDGQTDDTRVVIKGYGEDGETLDIFALNSARSPSHIHSEGNDLRILYLEGHWLINIQGLDYYPTSDEAGHLIEVNLSNESIIDRGLVWRSEVSIDPTDDNLDGYGVHTAFSSNMIQDDRDSLYFISGFDTPIDITGIALRTIFESPINKESNYILTQWGYDISTKIPAFPTNGRNTWSLLETLATLMNWEVGFGIEPKLLERLANRYPNESTSFGRNANLLFRPRQSLISELDSNMSSTNNTATLLDTPLSISIVSEFPEPPSGEVYYMMINDEIMSYSGTNDNDITGITRGILDTTIVSHSEGDTVFFLDYIATNEGDFRTLQNINDRTSDFPNIFNSIDVPYFNSNFTVEDQESIDEHGQSKYTVDNELLSQHDRPWAEILASIYISELSSIRQLIDFTIVFTPDLKVGQIILLHQPDRINIEYKKMRILRISHDIKEWITTITGREIIG